MDLIMAPLLVLLLFSPLILWVPTIRPYCVRLGKGYTTGANLMVALWVDWQTATELATARHDTGMRVVCGCFLAAHLFLFILFILSLTSLFI